MTSQSFCPNCGAAMAQGTRFCATCGAAAALPSSPPQSPAGVYPPPASPPANVPRPAEDKNRKLVLALGVFALLAVGAIGFAMGLMGGGSEPAKSATFRNVTYTLPAGWEAEETDLSNGRANLNLGPTGTDFKGGQGKGASVIVHLTPGGATGDLKQQLETQTGGSAKATDATYGRSGAFKGAEVRFNRKVVDADFVNVQLLLRAGDSTYQIAYLAPASEDAKHAPVFKAFLNSLELK
jgi:hypothetical protein